jgi:hypothetical protein
MPDDIKINLHVAVGELTNGIKDKSFPYISFCIAAGCDV